VVEEFASAAGGDAAYFLNAVSELALGPGAKVTHAVVQQQSRRCVHLQSTFVVQAATSDYALTDVALGARLGRHEVGALYDAALGSGFGFPVEQALQITNSCCSWLCNRRQRADPRTAHLERPASLLPLWPASISPVVTTCHRDRVEECCPLQLLRAVDREVCLDLSTHTVTRNPHPRNTSHAKPSPVKISSLWSGDARIVS
jgi:hypothetical protein